MASERFENVTHVWSSRASRRAMFARASSGLLTMAATVHDDEKATAKRKRCKRPTRPTPQPTCAERCGSDWTYCFTRPDSAPLCGNFYQGVFCVECTSDNDCAGSPQPYCVTDLTVLATGERERWDCPAYVVGICVNVQKV